MNDKEKAIIDSIDGWYIYDEIVAERRVYLIDNNFYVWSGEVKNSDGDLLFRAMIMDRETTDIYRLCFNSTWCPADHKEWLLQVVIGEKVDAIIQAKSLQRKRSSDSYSYFISTFRPGFMP